MKVCEEMDDLVFEVMILNHYNLYFATGPTELNLYLLMANSTDYSHMNPTIFIVTINYNLLNLSCGLMFQSSVMFGEGVAVGVLEAAASLVLWGACLKCLAQGH